jgi:hypothetical protein
MAPHELFGQWQLVALTGVAVPDHPKVHLLIGYDRIEAFSQCIPFNFSISLEQGRATIATQRWPGGVCARAQSPLENAFPAAMEGIRRVDRRRGDRIAFVGDEGEILLERPQPPPDNPFYNEPKPPPWLMWGMWRVAAVDGRPLQADGPIELLFFTRGIEARSGCVWMRWAFEQDWARLAITPEPWPHPICERTLSPAERAVRAILAGEVRMEGSTAAERVLIGEAGRVLLRR